MSGRRGLATSSRNDRKQRPHFLVWIRSAHDAAHDRNAVMYIAGGRGAHLNQNIAAAPHAAQNLARGVRSGFPQVRHDGPY
jgi:hypothetical protein